MMDDQANDLRRLVRRCGPSQRPTPARRPDLVLVTAGKGGVGTTTIAVNLAVALAQNGRRTVLVDADPRGGAAALCGLEERDSLADVLAGRRTAAEVLQPGPGAVRVLPGPWGLDRCGEYPPAAGGRLLGQLEGLGAQADLVVLDAGNSPHGILRRCWRAAQLILVVTTAETPSIINTYASIKALAEGDTAGPIHALVNLTPSAEVAENVQRRLARACRRFLGIRLQNAGHVPADPRVAAAATTARPFVIGAPGCDAARQLNRLATKVAGWVADGRTCGHPVQGIKQEPVRMTA